MKSKLTSNTDDDPSLKDATRTRDDKSDEIKLKSFDKADNSNTDISTRQLMIIRDTEELVYATTSKDVKRLQEALTLLSQSYYCLEQKFDDINRHCELISAENRNQFKKYENIQISLEIKEKALHLMEAVAMQQEDTIASLFRKQEVHDEEILQWSITLDHSLKRSHRRQMEVEDSQSEVYRNSKIIQDLSNKICELEVSLTAARSCDPMKLKRLNFDLCTILTEKNFWENKVISTSFIFLSSFLFLKKISKAKSLSQDLRKKISSGAPMHHKIWKLQQRLEEVM
jgi:hypothetical protein